MASEQKQGRNGKASKAETPTNIEPRTSNVEPFPESALKPDPEFANAIDKAVVLQARIRIDSIQLERLKAELREGARARLPEGKRRTPDGEAISLNGRLGIATVRFERDRAISAFWFPAGEGDDMAVRYKDNKVTPLGEMRRLAGKCFDLLFRAQYRPQRDFGNLVERLREKRKLPKAKAAELLSLCLEPSTPKVELEDLS